MSTFTVKAIEEVASNDLILTDRAPDWLSDDVSDDIFASGQWFAHFAAAALGPDEQARYLLIEGPVGRADASRTDAVVRTRSPVLALCVRTLPVWPYPRVLDSMCNYYSCGFGPIGIFGSASQAIRKLAIGLARVSRRYDLIQLWPLDRDGAFAREAEAGLAEARYSVHWDLAWGNWYADTTGLDYAGYLAKVASSFPATCEKRRQAFIRKRQGAISITTGREDLESEIDAYNAVYQSSWKTQEPFPEFIPGLIRIAADSGILRLGILRVNGEPAAAQLWFHVGERSLIYKVAYDERFSKLSVGSILQSEMFRHALDVDQAHEIDFLSGDDSYKEKWMFARRERFKLVAYNLSSAKGLAMLARRRAGELRARWNARSDASQEPPLSIPDGATQGKPVPIAADVVAAARPKWRSIPVGQFLSECRETWDALNRRCCGGHPVFESHVVFTALTHFPPQDMRAMVLGDLDAPRGIVLLERVGTGVWRNFQRSQMQVSSVLLDRADFDRLPDLFDELPAGTLAIEFLDQDFAYVEWPDSLADSPAVERIDAGKTGTISLHGRFEDYWGARSRNLRRDVAAWLRGLAREGRPANLRVVEAPDAIAESVRQFGLMESRGWKAKVGTAVHPDNPQGRYYREVFDAFAREGRAIAYELCAGDAVIARQLALASGPIVVTLKTTYDESFRRVAPGRLLDYEMLRFEFERKRFEAVELCTRADDMQLRWATSPRPMFHLSIYRSSLARRSVHWLREAAKPFRGPASDRTTMDPVGRRHV